MDAEGRARARDILDAQEGTGPVPTLSGDEARALLEAARRICIVGASPDRGRPSHTVMRYLQHQGYECVSVNPNVREVLGLRSFRNLEEAVRESGPFDIVDVFRRQEHTPAIARSTVATGCGALWLQLGVVNWQAASICHEAGAPVVMDRCTAIEHRRLREGRRGRPA